MIFYLTTHLRKRACSQFQGFGCFCSQPEPKIGGGYKKSSTGAVGAENVSVCFHKVCFKRQPPPNRNRGAKFFAQSKRIIKNPVHMHFPHSVYIRQKLSELRTEDIPKTVYYYPQETKNVGSPL